MARVDAFEPFLRHPRQSDVKAEEDGHRRSPRGLTLLQEISGSGQVEVEAGHTSRFVGLPRPLAHRDERQARRDHPPFL